LIGGLGVPAGVHYYENIARALPGANPFPILLAHADLETASNYASAGDKDGLAAYLGGIFTALSHAGATVGAIAAVTPHLCLEQLRIVSPIPIIDMPTVLNAAIHELGLKRVSLFGTSFVVESGLFGYLDADTVKPTPEETREVDTIYWRLARGAKASQADRERLSDVANRLLDREGVEAIVLAGTDFVALYDAEPPDFPAIDASTVHMEAIVRRMAGDV